MTIKNKIGENAANFFNSVIPKKKPTIETNNNTFGSEFIIK